MKRENWTDLQILLVDDDNGRAAACAMLIDICCLLKVGK